MNLQHIPMAVLFTLTVWVYGRGEAMEPVPPASGNGTSAKKNGIRETSQDERTSERKKTQKPVSEPVVVAKGPAHVVRTMQEAQAALLKARPGERILLRPGTYAGNLFLSGFKGRHDAYLVIGAADPSHPPVLNGGRGEAVKMTQVSYVALQDLVVGGASRNGFNIDDGGKTESPSHHIVLRRINIRRMNADGGGGPFKLAGVKNLAIEKCTFSNWGNQGCAIDMVGCHEGVVKECTFKNNSDGGSTVGIQAKGGSTNIVIRNCVLEHVGARAIQIGGQTGMPFFRPQPPSGFEAKGITVQGNIIVGCEAAVSFVNVDGSEFSRNTIYFPTGYVIRILQETSARGFVPCRNGVFTDNIIIFQPGRMAEIVNQSRGTEPKTFKFARNWWYAPKNPKASRVNLPSQEEDGVYGKDPQLVDAPGGDFHTKEGSPAAKVGASSLKPAGD